MDKKYTMIITSEDERYRTVADEKYGSVGYQLSHWTDNPWDGLLVGVVSGNTCEELFEQIDCEGLFYQIYNNDIGIRIGYGMVDYDSIKEEIEEFEKLVQKLNAHWK